jgi:D-xylose 1-dehydrogenase (NADP+, D-xylono-1,5-lactone-forming)
MSALIRIPLQGETMEKLRWGILSTARIGMEAVIPAIQQSSNGVVVAIASRDEARAQATAREMNIPNAFGSYEELIESNQVDAIYNPLPNHLHKEWSIRAMAHGKHVLCEKPFALNASQVDEMIAASKQYRVTLMEAFMYRFHPQFTKIKELIAQGEIGTLKTIRSAFCFTLNDADAIRLDRATGGGALMDVGCYCINMARLIAGTEPSEVRADLVWHANGQVEDSLSALLRFPGDVLGVFDCSFRNDYTEWLQIQGTHGRIDVPRPVKPLLQPAEIFIRHGEKAERFVEITKVTVHSANHYQLMCEHFGDVVLNRTPMLYPPELGRANMRVIDALYESAHTASPIRI